MTSTTTYDTKQASMISFRRYLTPCCPDTPWCDIPFMQTYIVSKTSKTSNDTDHRPRPQFLEMSPTPLALQGEQILIYGRTARYGQYYTAYTCPSTQKTIVEKRDQYYEVIPYSQMLSTPLDIDWSLDMRMKIADLKVNLSSSVAEYREAAGLFKQLAGALHNTYRALRKGKFNRFLSEYGSLKNIAASHLMWDFGLKPLAHDLGASVAALTHAQEFKPVIRRFVVTKRDNKEFTAGAWNGKVKTSVRAIAYVEFETNWSPIEIGNPLEWAWELIPFSFVVDWAFPIGDWLGSLDAMKGVRNTTGTVTTKREYYHEMDPQGYWDNDLTIITPASMSLKTHERIVISDVPIPPFPGYEPSQSFRNVAQGLSLLAVIHDWR